MTDVLATLAHVLEVPLTKGNAEDSFDVLRAFTEEKQGAPVRDHIVLQAADSTYAIRMGDWKLVERTDAPKVEPRNKKKAELAEKRRKAGAQHDELFDVKKDVAEATDASTAHADLVAKLKQQLTTARDQGFTRTGAK